MSEAVREMTYDEPQTNADRFRAMTDEELAKQLSLPFCCGAKKYRDCTKTTCFQCIYEWLKATAEENW